MFEEALETVITVRDFSMVWDAYTKFEDDVIAAKILQLQSVEEVDEEETFDFELRVRKEGREGKKLRIQEFYHLKY